MVADDIYSVILEYEHKVTGTNSNTYFEPFCGGFNMTRRVCVGPKRKRITVCDMNENMVSLYRAISTGWGPKHKLVYDVSKQQYSKYMDSRPRSDAHRADRTFVGLAWSKYGWLYNGYEPSTYPVRLSREIEEIRPLIRMTKILDASSYDAFEPINCVVYCDPPYERTDIYHQFDTRLFWDVMRKWSRDNMVFVSEEKAPQDFKCVWQAKIIKENEQGATITRTDKLFVIK